MTLNDLGFHEGLQQYCELHHLQSFEIGRVTLEHKERYIVKTPNREFEAELIGNLRFTAKDRYDLPAVGDWVAISEYDETKALIHAILPRYSIIERQAVGKHGQTQIIATNIDYALIVQAVDRDFNLNRLERYLTISHASKVKPLIILSKIDLISSYDLDSLKNHIQNRMKEVPIICTSNQEHGYQKLLSLIQKSKSYCLLGSSGVGKSTLLNHLAGMNLMETKEISTSVKKGVHTTSHRELFVLPSGGIIIDNPGMREVGIADTEDGLEITFEHILEFAQNCKYDDCTHMHENGCAVIQAVEDEEISREAYSNFQKMHKEKIHFESDTLERKKKDKDFGKMVKNVKKQRKLNKF